MSIQFIEFIFIALGCVALAALVLFIAGIFIFRRFRNKKPVIPPLPQSPLASPTPAAATVALPRCPQCHLPLAPNTPEGLCPACLAKVALGSEPAAPEATININPSAQAAPGARVPPDPAQLAAHFPQLEIIELLGMGGMGMVYKARQPRLDRIVALKILPVDSAQHPSFAERFNREAKALAKLNHPGIVNVYDFGQSGQYYYFIMEFVDGMNLRELLNKEPVTPRQALELVVQICTALQFAHDEGVVHRDIKPENILLNKKGQVKIADFGLAKLLGAAPDTALTMSQAAMGTLNYMAPEQRQNAQGVDHRADIYSLGVVFYEMLTGEVPMGRFEAPSKRVQVDVRLDEVVLRALEREPARRYQHVSEVKSNVENITATPQASPMPPAEPGMAKIAPTRFFTFMPGIAKIAPTRFPTLTKVLVLLAIVVGILDARNQIPDWLEQWLLPVGIVLGTVFIINSRQQIQQARARGLWPQSGELPTLEHVKRLAQADEKILAIKLYRQIHGASLAEAKAAVEKLMARSAMPQDAKASPADAAGANPASASAVSPGPSQPCLSRMAFGGAACFIFFVAVVVCSLVFYLNMRERIQPGWHFAEGGWQFGAVLLASLAVAAALSTTVCGWVAVTNIRRSSGAIYGLGLALFDALVFPLLFADFLVLVLVFSFTPMIVTLMFGSLQPNSAFNRLSIAAVSLLAAAVLDFFIVRKVWRSYRR